MESARPGKCWYSLWPNCSYIKQRICAHQTASKRCIELNRSSDSKEQRSDFAATNRFLFPGEDKIAKAKVDASQILDAFEKDQDAQQLFRNAEKMIDGEFDAEAAREFWNRWRTLSLFEKTKLWLQSSRYEMLQLD